MTSLFQTNVAETLRNCITVIKQTTHYLPNFVQNGSLFKKTEPRCLRNIYGKIEMPYMFFKMCGYKDSRCKSC